MAHASARADAPIPGVQVTEEIWRADLPGNCGVTISSFATDRSRIGAPIPTARYRVERRDLRQQFDIDPQRRSYRILPIWSLLSEKEQEQFIHSGRHWRKIVQAPEPSVLREVRILHTYTPTGESKSAFGCTATRWTIVRRDQRDPTYGKNRNESITDAWYLDADELEDRYPGFSPKLVHRCMVSLSSSDERVVHETEGKPPRGLCVYSETRQHSYLRRPDGELREHTAITVSNITAMTSELFESSFFDLPAGFRRQPVYPSRFALLRSDLKRSLNQWRWRIFNRS
jgi:hypothetical protein